MIETGVIHGRFQVLHMDHLKYLKAGKERCGHLVVGITNPDPTLTRPDPADQERTAAASNPLTYFERYTMVVQALLEAGFKISRFSVVPFPINVPDLYGHYVPLDGTFFLTIYDAWGRRKLQQFKALGLKTEVLWEKPLSEKGLSGSTVRKLMAQEASWAHLVPPSTGVLMKKWNIPERIRRLSEATS